MPEYVKFAKIIFSGFSLILIFGGVASTIGFFLDTEQRTNLYVGIALLVVVILTAMFTYYQERKSSNIMEGFKNLVPKRCKVLRDGSWASLDVTEIVIGDVVELEKGDAVPADMRVVKCDGLKVDNSSLTGESEPQSRAVDVTHENPLETKNLLFFGTNVNEGSGVGVVIHIGDGTMIGKIAQLMQSVKEKPTPIRNEMHRFIKFVAIVAFIIGALFFILSLTVNQKGLVESIVLLIGIVVANIPEGLLATVTVGLTITAKKMATKNVLVKNLEAVETLGSTSVICSDKTGTLTQNRMTVSHLFYDHTVHACDTTGETEGHQYNLQNPSYASLDLIGALCSRAVFTDENEEVPLRDKSILGDASETAILRFCESMGSVMAKREEYPTVFQIPFNSVNKYQVSIHKVPHSEQLLLVMKGAPERILSRCSKVLIEGEEVLMDKPESRLAQEGFEKLGGLGERVLGFCHLYLPEKFTADYQFDAETQNFPLNDLVFVGFMSLIDPPRPEVPIAIEKCKTAGIKVIMVTGDHAATAEAIAKKIGIITGETLNDIARREGKDISEVDPDRADAIVVPGSQIDEFSQDDWKRVLNYNQIVFARTSPQQKYIIVEQNQLLGNVVAVTGDGVNDSPALKKANIGISMGIQGSDVSKEAANMILLDDNFASIVNGIEQGRLIFDNLTKSIAYTLSSNFPEIIPFLTTIILGLPLPISTLLILMIDLGTDLLPAISLAHEPAESDIMKRKPRRADVDRLVTAKLVAFSYLQMGLIQTFSGFTMYFYTFFLEGLNPGDILFKGKEYEAEGPFRQFATLAERDFILRKAQTSYFLASVITRMMVLIVCKTRRKSIFSSGLLNNYPLLLSLAFETVLATLICYAPGIQEFFQTENVNVLTLWPAVLFSAFVLFYDEIRKFVIRKRPFGIVARLTAY